MVDVKRALVEFIGTYILVLVFIKYPLPIVTAVSITILLLLGNVLSFEVHYNPILSTIKFLIKKLSMGEYISTLITQFLGSYLAYLTNNYYKSI